jgi:hypothetical protein
MRSSSGRQFYLSFTQMGRHLKPRCKLVTLYIWNIEAQSVGVNLNKKHNDHINMAEHKYLGMARAVYTHCI